MRENWEFGALLVAVFAILVAITVAALQIVFATSPAALQFFVSLLHKSIGLFAEDKTSCERLTWEDMYSSPLHTCSQNCCDARSSNTSSISKPGSLLHVPTQRCYKSTVGQVLNVSWNRKRAKIKKPPYLSIGTGYLRVDGNVLLLYMVLTARGSRSFSSQAHCQMTTSSSVTVL